MSDRRDLAARLDVGGIIAVLLDERHGVTRFQREQAAAALAQLQQERDEARRAAFTEAAQMVRDFAGPPLIEPTWRLHKLADQLDAHAAPPGDTEEHK